MNNKKQKKTILIVDDEYGARASLKVILDGDYKLLFAENYSEALPFIVKKQCDLVLLDICMPDKSGLELLRDIRKKGISVPVVMVTATKTLKTAVEAMKQGAYDYITKPFDVEEIQAIVSEIFNDLEFQNIDSAPSMHFNIKNVIGYSTTLKNTYKLIEKLAKTDSTVLILGESGTGKELIARSIHAISQRASNNFVPVHLSAISENLIESELFGHVKGAFTGADKDRLGAFELGDKGTIFLDEIGEIKESVQIKLLRVIQEREYKPVGDAATKNTNARIIAATNKELYSMVEEGKFRADLYYRLNVVPIKLPPLRDRTEDIPELVDFFIKKIASRIKIFPPKIDKKIIEAFIEYSWPGNIRELENTLENMLLLCEDDILGEDNLPHNILGENKKEMQVDEFSSENGGNVLSSMEKETIQVALLRNNGVLTSTAKYLGTTRRILKYKMDKLGIEKTEVLRN